MEMITGTNTDTGRLVFINPAHIVAVFPYGESCNIWLSTGGELSLAENAAEIEEQLSQI